MYFSNFIVILFIETFYIHEKVLAKGEIGTEENKDLLDFIHDRRIILKPNDDKSCHQNQSTPWCFPRDYDKDVEPWKFRDLINRPMPWFYNLSYKVFDLREVDDQKQTLSLDLNLKLKWYEPRIEINFTDAAANEQITKIDGEDHINIPLRYLKQFWIPDSEIYYIKKYETISILTPTASFRVNQKKLLRYVARANVVLSCQMKFENYPFDYQHCYFRHGSFYNPMEIVNCSSQTTHYKDSQRSLQYYLRILDLPPEQNIWESEGRLWATCGFTIELKRKKIQIAFQVYFTSILLVVISWFSFIIDPNVVPGRMGLLVTVFLMLITVFIGVKTHEPAANGYLNAVDEFLVACIGEIFGAFLEYALVLHFYKCNNGKLCKTSTSKNIKSAIEHTQTQQTSSRKILQLASGWIEEIHSPISLTRYNIIDRFSIIVFPISFLVFCIAYFTYYYYVH